MAWEEDLVARATALAGLTVRIGDRASWFELPREGGLPAMLLTKVSPGQSWTHEGPVGLINPRVQFDFYAEDPDVTAEMSRAWLVEMQRADEVTIGDTVFLPPALLEGEMMLADQIGGTATEDGLTVFRVMQDMSFFCKPAT